MKPKVYLETTVVSYLTAWRSRDVVMAGNQEETRAWWDDRRQNHDVFISGAVVQEAIAGDVDAAGRRLDALKDVPELETTDAARDLAKVLVAHVPFPERAQVDALHIAVATVHGMDYLLTWNCRHIANAALRRQIESVCRANGYTPPIICTPSELAE
jgi:hypothetical protein